MLNPPDFYKHSYAFASKGIGAFGVTRCWFNDCLFTS